MGTHHYLLRMTESKYSTLVKITLMKASIPYTVELTEPTYRRNTKVGPIDIANQNYMADKLYSL